MLASGTMSLSPRIFEDRRVKIAAVIPGDHAPKMEAVSVIDAVQSGHVNASCLAVLRQVEAVDVFGDEAEGLGRLGCRTGTNRRGRRAKGVAVRIVRVV